MPEQQQAGTQKQKVSGSNSATNSVIQKGSVSQFLLLHCQSDLSFLKLSSSAIPEGHSSYPKQYNGSKFGLWLKSHLCHLLCILGQVN